MFKNIQIDFNLNPFIMVLSGQNDQDSVNRAMKSGANNYMDKPTDF
jgi:DNA-binding response OmpR family regulator